MSKLTLWQWAGACLIGAIILDSLEEIAAAFGSGKTYCERELDREDPPKTGVLSRITGK